jgi:hypothetical protein
MKYNLVIHFDYKEAHFPYRVYLVHPENPTDFKNLDSFSDEEEAEDFAQMFLERYRQQRGRGIKIYHLD